jgi:hypothetical protein
VDQRGVIVVHLRWSSVIAPDGKYWISKKPFAFAGLIAAILVGIALPAHAQLKFKQVTPQRPQESGQGVTPAYEGWWQNPDGTYNLLFGYFNRNTKETLDIPIGPSNHIGVSGGVPGPADQGQPTHFLPRRQRGVFTVTVPKDFGDKKVVWTLVANGQTLSVPGHLGAAWIINPMSEVGIGNTPPTISLDETGPSIQGPRPLLLECTAKAGEPLSFTVFAADDDRSIGIRAMRVALEVALSATGGKATGGTTLLPAAGTGGEDAVATPELLAAAAVAGFDAETVAIFKGGPSVTLTWQKYRGTGAVTFDNPQPNVDKVPGSEIPVKNVFNGKATTIVTFGEPGEYMLRVVANDSSGPDGGDFVCCWTNAEIRVKVE